ncbi:hypothetical protein SteCoe_17604 [Stentor coeruleus]|uniref:Uncharacterized protein n=1 Tax=Stentor coeruleus TaxID=5963 RepID=A0A1R2BYQ3_9CILI|nr:hypothetical protein SteCoe_17604 [Stentor coeruleus]
MSYYMDKGISVKDIKNSLEKSRRLLEKSASLTREERLKEFDRMICNKCHICSTGDCLKVSHKDLKSKFIGNDSLNNFASYDDVLAKSQICKPRILEFPSPEYLSPVYDSISAKSLKYENYLLNSENSRLAKTVQDLNEEISFLKVKLKSQTEPTSFTKPVNQRIIEFENKVHELENIMQIPLGYPSLSTAVSEKVIKINEKMNMTDLKYDELRKKIESAEKNLRPYRKKIGNCSMKKKK